MDAVDLIVQEVSNEDLQTYEMLRAQLATKKALSKENFNTLTSLLERDPIAILEFPSPTFRETVVISKALVRARLADATRLFTYLAAEDTKRAPVLIRAVLSKHCKINTDFIVEYLHRLIEKRKIFLCHLRILLAVSKDYPRAITPAVLEFCRRSAHGIAREILSKHALEVEQ